MLLEEMPDPRPHRVQAEIKTCVEVKDDHLPLEIAGEDAIRNAHARCQGEFLLQAREPRMIVCSSKLQILRIPQTGYRPPLPSVK